MISTSRALIGIGLVLAPNAFASTVNRRAAGDPINFDIRIWSTEGTDSMIPTAYYDPSQNMTATSNVQYTANNTNPDVKNPQGAQETYVIIGQLHFNEVPGTSPDPTNPMKQPRKMYIFTGQQTPGEASPGEKAVYCEVTFDNDPGIEDLNWFLRAPDPFDGRKPEDMNIVCSGDVGVVNLPEAAVVTTTNPDGSSATSSASEMTSTTMAASEATSSPPPI